MLEILVIFLLILVPGIIGVLILEHTGAYRMRSCCEVISVALVFDLLTLIINFLGLRIFKNICDLKQLLYYFKCLSFAAKYGLLSIAVAVIIALIAAIILKLFNKKKRHPARSDE